MVARRDARRDAHRGAALSRQNLRRTGERAMHHSCTTPHAPLPTHHAMHHAHTPRPRTTPVHHAIHHVMHRVLPRPHAPSRPGAPPAGEERPRARLPPARRAERARAPAHRWDAPDQPRRPRGRMLHMFVGHTHPARGTTLARAQGGPLGSAAAPGPLGPSLAPAASAGARVPCSCLGPVLAPLRGAAQAADAAALAPQARARPT